jgi:Zn-dependent protease with chaperone function
MLVEPIQNLISRQFEREADTYALLRTQDFDAYRSAFTRLASLNKADPDPHAWEVFLFHSHPPIAARLRLAEHVRQRTG